MQANAGGGGSLSPPPNSTNILTILTMPLINESRSTLDLDLPTEKNTGGYRILITNSKGQLQAIPAYSPIDLTIASLSELLKPEPKMITNLSRWYLNNKPLAEPWVSCTINDYGTILHHTISEFRSLFKLKPYLFPLFKRNSPFLFRD